MNPKLLTLAAVVSLLLCMVAIINAGPLHIPTNPDVYIVGYTGALTKKTMKLIRRAETLTIKDCNITRISNRFLAQMKKLKKISFENSTINIDQVDLDNLFTGAHRLEEIQFSNIDSDPVKLQMIQSSVAQKFSLTDHSLPQLSANLLNGTQLEKLDLSRDELEIIDDDAFNGLHNLTELTLNSNKIKTLTKAHWEDLKNLKELSLKDNAIEKFDAGDMLEMPNLEKIDLSNNPLKELKLDGIETKAPKLSCIGIAGTTFASQVDDLKAKHPKIHFKTEE